VREAHLAGHPHLVAHPQRDLVRPNLPSGQVIQLQIIYLDSVEDLVVVEAGVLAIPATRSAVALGQRPPLVAETPALAEAIHLAQLLHSDKPQEVLLLVPKRTQSVLVSVVAVWAEATHWAATLAGRSAVSVGPPVLLETLLLAPLAVGAMRLALLLPLHQRSEEVSAEAWAVGHLVSNKHSLRQVDLDSAPLQPPPLVPHLPGMLSVEVV